MKMLSMKSTIFQLISFANARMPFRSPLKEDMPRRDIQ